MIASQSREGWFQSRILAGFRFGTTPALRATPPDSGGVARFVKQNSFTLSLTAKSPGGKLDFEIASDLFGKQ